MLPGSLMLLLLQRYDVTLSNPLYPLHLTLDLPTSLRKNIKYYINTSKKDS